MKIYYLGFVLFLFMACQKQSEETSVFIQDAKNYFATLPAFAKDTQTHAPPFQRMDKVIDWSKAKVKKISTGNAVVIPIAYTRPIYLVTSFNKQQLQDINNLQSLLIYKDRKQNWHTELVTDFDEIIRVEDLQGHLLKEYKYEPSGLIKKWTPIAKATNNSNNSREVEICYTSSGYNYIAGDQANGYAWEISLGCEYYFIEEINTDQNSTNGSDYGVNGIGGQAENNNGSNSMVTVYSGNNIIGNIQDYNKCFDNIAGSTKQYSVTVCVEQPIEGSRKPWGINGTGSSSLHSPVAVGHTFMVLTESGDDGLIIRNIGFYPKAIVYPSSPISAGTLNNDSYNEYNIALTINMDNSQFFKVLGFINNGNDPNYNYDLNSNNCTTFVINALSSAGIVLPATKGNWPGGEGYDPGDLGEDIRLMHLSANMIKKTVSNNHPNVGNCY